MLLIGLAVLFGKGSMRNVRWIADVIRCAILNLLDSSKVRIAMDRNAVESDSTDLNDFDF